MERQKKKSFFILEFYRYFMKIKAPTVFELGTLKKTDKKFWRCKLFHNGSKLPSCDILS